MNTQTGDPMVQDGQFSPDFTQVEKEADKSELIKIIRELTNDDELQTIAIKKVVDALPLAIAALMHRAPSDKPGQRRAELHGGIIVRAKVKPARLQKLPGGNEVNVPEHFKLYIKGHKGFLDVLSEQFGIEFWNG